jgi:hypothetical protein
MNLFIIHDTEKKIFLMTLNHFYDRENDIDGIMREIDDVFAKYFMILSIVQSLLDILLLKLASLQNQSYAFSIIKSRKLRHKHFENYHP